MVEWQWRSLPGASGQRQMPGGAAQARAHARTPGDGVIWRPDFSGAGFRSEEHTSELQSLMRISYAVFCLKKKRKSNSTHHVRLSHKINKHYPSLTSNHIDVSK